MAAGDKMAEALKRIADGVAKRQTVSVGFLAGATYPNNAHTSVAAVAAFNNFGTSKSKPRPFFTRMVAEKSPKWGAKLAKVLIAADYDAKLALERMGLGIKGQLEDAIVAFNDPADSDATIARKQAKHGKNATLVDTGVMLKSIDFEVSE